MVLAAEVGRWSEETAEFLAALTNAKAQASPFILQNRVKGRPERSQLPCWTSAPCLVGEETRLQVVRDVRAFLLWVHL